MNAPRQLAEAGQSLWLDNIAKRLITDDTLAGYIRDLAVTGVTSNPSILERAIVEGDDYDDAIARHTRRGTTDAEGLAFALALDDLLAAADLLRPVFDATAGADGYVSIEVSPTLADDSAATITAGQSLFAVAGRPHVMIKVPGTPAGLVAVEELIAAGVPVNVTLLFSPDQYRRAADAHLRGIERRVDACPIPTTSAGWRPPARSTPSPRPRSSRSQDTARSATSSIPTPRRPVPSWTR